MPSALPMTGSMFTCSGVADGYDAHAERVYRRATDNRLTRNHKNVALATQMLRALWGDIPADEFTVEHLKAMRLAWCRRGLVRNTINQRTRIVRRAFDWAATYGHVSDDTAARLRTLTPLKRGDAPEGRGVRPVSIEVVHATLPHLEDDYADMVRLLLLTGARVGEVIQAHADAVTRTPSGYALVPEHHKTSHHGIVRVIPLVDEALSLLRVRIDRGGYLFTSPRSDHPGGSPYSETSLYQAIRRACRRGGVEAWSPGRIRHLCATQVAMASESIEAASALLGHTNTNTTRTYVHAQGAGAAMTAARYLARSA